MSAPRATRHLARPVWAAARAAAVAAAVAGAVLLLAVGPALGADTPSFPDVPVTHPYKEAIADLASRGIIGGFDNGNFGPDDPVSRQQFAKMIMLAGSYPVSEADVCPFLDVATSGASGLYPDNYVAACAAAGITTGKTASTFDPYGSITRHQVVSMVVRAADDLRPGLLTQPPGGPKGTSPWTADPIHGANAARAAHGGLLAGLPLATLDPSAAMSRGEVAQVLHNLLAALGSSPQPSSYTLSVSVAAGAGAVTVSPQRAAYQPGETVTLTAVPASGYVFAGWGGGTAGLESPKTIVVNADMSITATFLTGTSPLFENLGGFITSAPAVCSRAHRLVDVFARDAAGALMHTSWDGSAWSTWEDLGGSLKAGSDPAAVSWGRDRLDVFVRGTDDALWHRAWNGSGWGDWENLGKTLSTGPAAAYRDAGGGQHWVDVFVADAGGRLWRRTSDGSTWGEWTALDQPADTPSSGFSLAAVTWGRLRIDLFMRGDTGAVWHSYLPTSGRWSEWENLGGNVSSSPVACTYWSWAEGRLDLFARGADNELWHRALISGVWSGWEKMSLGVLASAPAAVSWEPERFELFVRGTDGALWHKTWTGSSWLW